MYKFLIKIAENKSGLSDPNRQSVLRNYEQDLLRREKRLFDKLKNKLLT